VWLRRMMQCVRELQCMVVLWHISHENILLMENKYRKLLVI